MRLDTLTIVGVGLIGGSVGMAARERRVAHRVIGVGRSADSLDQARARGAIDAGTFDLEEAARTSDLILFCTPVDRIATQVKAAAAAGRPGTVLTDAGSTKALIVQELDEALPSGMPFVGGHPLAGSEKRGPEHARADLFEDRLVVLTPTMKTEESALGRVTLFWRALGARIKLMEPRTHDEALAITSHLPHLIAATLASILPDEFRELAATGFRDTTRIAASDPELWAAIFAQNRDAVCRAVGHFRDRLADMTAALYADNTAALHDLLTHAKQVRDALGS